MSDLDDILSTILSDPDHHFNCMQIAPYGDGGCAFLYELGTVDHDVAVSLVHETYGFDPSDTRRLLVAPEWFISLSAASATEIYALEVGRTVWQYDGSEWTTEKVANTMMKRLWVANPGMAFVFGYKGRAWRGSRSAWEAIEPAGRSPLNDMHGPDISRLWAVGNSGVLQRLTDSGWRREDAGTTVDFRGVHVSSKDEIRIAGDDGTCLRIANGELVDLENPGSTFFGVTEYKGRFYWGDSQFGVYVENGNVLEPFHDTDLGYDLRTDGDYLFVVGSDRCWRFDGETWKSLRLLYDGEFRFEA